MPGPLSRLAVLRVRSALRHPPLASWIGIALPLALAIGALWAGGAAATPTAATVSGSAMLGMLIGAPVSFFAYGILFRAVDDGFLRRLGIPPESLFIGRTGRLLGLGIGLALLLLIPFLSSGQSIADPLAAGLAGAFAAWGFAVATLSLAARALSLRVPGGPAGCLGFGMKWDPELKSVAPLVYAPIPPLLAGTAAGAMIGGAAGAGWMVAVPIIIAATLLVAASRRAFARALPRFAPRALEMSFVPPPSGEGAELRARGGVAHLLPRRAALVWARDALVAGRRFGWATRVIWPVALVSVIALARWGREPSTRAWVGAITVAVWLVQAAAIVGLGRLERSGRRWIDRSVGIGAVQRLLGRWAWGWGLALWLGIPVALAWSIWTSAGLAWLWLAAGGLTAGVAALASITAAGWR